MAPAAAKAPSRPLPRMADSEFDPTPGTSVKNQMSHFFESEGTLPRRSRTPLEDLVPFTEAFWELPC